MKSSLTSQDLSRARRTAARADALEPRAAAVRYDKKADQVIIRLRTGVTVEIPRRLIQGLAMASHTDLEPIQITPSGEGLRWNKLDLDFSVPALLLGVFGTRAWMTELGRFGGSKTSSAKAAAARRNGLQGGRPAARR